MILDLTRKTGYRVIDITRPVIIVDSQGKTFYDTTDIVPRVRDFNLPLGIYTVTQGKGNITELPEPKIYRFPTMPKKEHSFPRPMGFQILFGENKNKCTINFFNESILFDNSFKDKTPAEFDFVKFHEFGHQYYKMEKLADLMSAIYMYQKGYNTSQIIKAQQTSLSDRQLFRKQNLVKTLLSTNGLTA